MLMSGTILLERQLFPQAQQTMAWSDPFRSHQLLQPKLYAINLDCNGPWMQIHKRNCPDPASNCHYHRVSFTSTFEQLSKVLTNTGQKFTWDLNGNERIHLDTESKTSVVAYSLSAIGLCPDVQQSSSLSDYQSLQFRYRFRPDLTHVPVVRLADLWPLTMMPLRSPAQYQSQQQSPCTTAYGQPMPKRVQNEPWRSEKDRMI